MAKEDDFKKNEKTQKDIYDFIKGKSSKKNKNSKKDSKINYESLATGQKAARIGLDSEKEIINAINTNQSFRELVRNCLQNLGFMYEGEMTCEDAPKNMKTDITIKIARRPIGVSIKSIKETSFHQTDRRRLEKWKEFLNMPDNIYDIIKTAIIRKAEKGRASKFILDKDKKTIRNFFSAKYEIIIKEIFSREEKDLLILLINNIKDEKIYLYRMGDVFKFLIKNVSNNIDFTVNGIIKLGDYLTIQRKSGNGKHIKIPKTDWKHPGNDLQFKFYPIEFAIYIKENKLILFSEFDYKLQIFQ